MSRKITAVIPFKIESYFYELANKFDSKSLYISHNEFDIKILSKCFSKDDPQKLICIQKALGENIQNFLQSNSEWIRSHIVYFLTMEEFL